MTTSPTFELRRFAWGMPDRLEVSGTFSDLGDTPADGVPVLVVRAGDTVHRLPAVPDSLDGPPKDGRVWEAQFAWQDPPVAFGEAELQLGAGLIVELPEPGAKRRLVRPRVVKVREVRAAPADEADSRPDTTPDSRPETTPIKADPPAPADTAPERAAPNAQAGSLGSQVDLLAAQEEVREVQASLQQAQAELARAHQDLQAERERRAGDGQRFREGLAAVRGSAEQALTDEQAKASRLGTDLDEAKAAIESQDAALETLREQREAADAARTQAEAKAKALREQVAKLETAGKATERLRAELDKAHGAVDQARSDAERLLSRLTSIRAK